MAIGGSPKKMAEEIAAGYHSLNDAVLKKYTPQDLKTIISNLQVVLRELRAEQVDLDDVTVVKAKNMKMSRVTQAMTMVQAFAKRRRIRL